MGLETGNRIEDLDPNNPTGVDPKSQGDDHLRLIKLCVQGSFPNLGPDAVTLTALEINGLLQRVTDLEAEIGAPGENILVDGVETAQVGVQVVSANTTLLDTDVNNSVHCTSAATITLADGAAVGKQHMIYNWSTGDVTITTGTDTLNSIQGAASNVVLSEYGQACHVVKGSATVWYASAPEA